MNDEAMRPLTEGYELASRQLDSWRESMKEADRKLRECVRRKWKAALTRKARALCRQHTVSKGRHWWLEVTEVHYSVDHSTRPWTFSVRAKVRVGLYIHEDGEVARDELEIGFDVEEAEVALARLGRMMAAGVCEAGDRIVAFVNEDVPKGWVERVAKRKQGERVG